MKILVKDKIAESGIDLMRKNDFEVEKGYQWSRDKLLEEIKNYHAIIVRSSTQVDGEVISNGFNLQVIGRAGVGVDNIDIEKATQKGIIVCNAPESNILSAAEHTIALLLSLIRNIPQAYHSLKYKNKWERSKYLGIEFHDKKLGIVGLGKVGSIVATKARGLGMQIIAFDPYVSEEKFSRLGVERVETLDEILKASHFLTIHLPKTKETIGMISDKQFQAMKDGIYIINTARGGIVSEKSLLKYLKEGKVAGAALDVYEREPCTQSPLFELDNVIVTPHLGASTKEAQDKAGSTIAEQVMSALKGEFVSNALNIPMIPVEQLDKVKPYLPLAELLGNVLSQIYKNSINKIEIQVSGMLSETDPSLITVGVLKGFFSNVVEEPVSYVNAPIFAKERGIEVREVKTSSRNTAHPDEIVIALDGFKIAGTAVAPSYIPRLTQLYEYYVDIAPSKHMLIIENEDRPGIVGKLGTLLGKHNINIASMQVGRREKRGKAVSIVIIDESVSEDVLSKIRKLDGIVDAVFISL